MKASHRRTSSAERTFSLPSGSRSAGWHFLTLGLSLALGVPGPVVAQEPPQPGEFVPRALVTAGFVVEPDESPRPHAYELFNARLGASGLLGLGVEYLVTAGTSPLQESAGLIDARLSVPVASDLRLTVGQFRAPFSREALLDPDELQFARRAQGPSALAPFRQVGLELSGELLEERLAYRAGMFNGEGRSSANPDGDFLYAGRVEYRREPGPGRYFDELTVDVGANVAFSNDSARDVSDAGPFRRPGFDPASFRGRRLMWGSDVRVAYRRFFAAAEYLRTRFDPAAPDPPGSPTESQVAEGLSVDVGSEVWPGVVDLVVRWDGFDPPAGSRRDFLVLGANLYPGLRTRLGLQYSLQVDEAEAADRTRGTIPGELADGQFIVRLEASL